MPSTTRACRLTHLNPAEKTTTCQLCQQKNIGFNEPILKSVLWGNIKEWIEKNVRPMVETMANEAGHKVLWSPPHHSDLQPIELVWANVKGEV